MITEHLPFTSLTNYAAVHMQAKFSRLRLKCDGTRAETRFSFSAKRMSPFELAQALVQSTTGSRGVCISGSNAGYTMIWGGVKGTGYPLHWPVSPSLPLLCITMCHHVSTGLYYRCFDKSHSFLPHTILILLHSLTCQFLCCLHGNMAHTCTHTHLGEVQLYFGYNDLG